MFDPPAPDHVASKPVTDHATPATAEDLASELAQARERLSFYESFDTLIRDNVLRSGELLREAAAEKEQTEQRLLEMRAEVDRRLAEQRSALEEIAAGLSGLQANLAALGERVSGALGTLPASGSDSVTERPSNQANLADRVSTPAGTLAGTEEGHPAATIAPDVAAANPDVDIDLRVPELRVDAAAVPALAATTLSPAGAVVPGPEDIAAGVPDTAQSTVPPDDAGPIRRKIDLIVHGVPKAATALSLQRHLQELNGVDTVEVREYVSGVLRFQVVAAALRADDFGSWPGGDGLEVITVREDVLELKLPTADSF